MRTQLKKKSAAMSKVTEKSEEKNNWLNMTLFKRSLVLQLKVVFTCWCFYGSARGKMNVIKPNPYQSPMLYAMWYPVPFPSCIQVSSNHVNYPEICRNSVSIFDSRICCIWTCSSVFVQAAGLCSHFSDILKDSSLATVLLRILLLVPLGLEH